MLVRDVDDISIAWVFRWGTEAEVRSNWLWAAAAVAALAIAMGAFMLIPMGDEPQSNVDQARARTTANGLFVAAIAPETEPVQQGVLHSWILTLKTPDGKPVEDATIEVGGGMPEHNHGLPTSPTVTQHLGDGRYRVEGVKFTMGGWWELRFKITSAVGTDDVTFNLVL